MIDFTMSNRGLANAKPPNDFGGFEQFHITTKLFNIRAAYTKPLDTLSATLYRFPLIL